MGGIGSGRPQTRTYLDSLLRLELKALRPYLRRPPARLQCVWPAIGYAIEVSTEPDHLTLEYVARQGDQSVQIREHIAIERQPRHYGGAEAYVRCPRCSQRATKLFLRETRFCCRHCAALPYRSQSLEPEHRLARTHNRHRRKINPDATQLPPGHIPARPRYMHRRTYHRLAKAAEDAWAARQTIVLRQMAGFVEQWRSANGLPPPGYQLE